MARINLCNQNLHNCIVRVVLESVGERTENVNKHYVYVCEVELKHCDEDVIVKSTSV